MASKTTTASSLPVQTSQATALHEAAWPDMPEGIETNFKGSPDRQKTAYDKIETNVPMDDARFQMPTRGK